MKKTCNNCKWFAKSWINGAPAPCMDCTAKMIDRWEPNLLWKIIIKLKLILKRLK